MSEFARWETRFAGPEYVFGTAPNEFLCAQAHLLPARGKVLAVADGEGRNGVWLAEQGLDVLSVDFSPKAQAKAQALAKARGVPLRTERVDLITWTWPTEAFDVVAAIFIQFVGPEERKPIFAGMRQALKPGGLLLLQGYRRAAHLQDRRPLADRESLHPRRAGRGLRWLRRSGDFRARQHDPRGSRARRHGGFDRSGRPQMIGGLRTAW